MDWHPEDIKAAVRKRGTTLASLGRHLGLSRQIMAMALVRPDPRAERAIADELKVPPSTIWPSRYFKDGRRKTPQPLSNWRCLPAQQAREMAR